MNSVRLPGAFSRSPVNRFVAHPAPAQYCRLLEDIVVAIAPIPPMTPMCLQPTRKCKKRSGG
jgi:hypothetical protein